MVKSRIVLMVLSIIVLLMGIMALVDISASFSEPSWHAVLKIVVALIALVLGYMDKG
jgi:hypothetical protein